MAAMAQLRFAAFSGHNPSCIGHPRISSGHAHRSCHFAVPHPSSSCGYPTHLFQSISITFSRPLKFEFSCGSGGGGNNGTGGSGSGGGGWSGDGHSDGSSKSLQSLGILGLLLNGWRSRVAADPQFPFKVLMEELVGVSACVLGDMASRPNFGLDELDFVFSTLVVGSIMNFTLMYLLAPTMSSASPNLPGIFSACPPGHMFEVGHYGFVNRLGTFVYKGAVFAAVGFAAGLVGTAISNGLIAMRKKMDPSFETPNEPPPTVLNATTWAIHMGVSSNLRYQTLNGIEFLLAKGLPTLAFKTSVVALRCLNNILGGMSFVILARMTGSQPVEEEKPAKAEKVTLVDVGADLQINQQSAAK